MADKKTTLKKMVSGYGKGGPGVAPGIASSSTPPKGLGYTAVAPNANPGLRSDGAVPVKTDSAVSTGKTYLAPAVNPVETLAQTARNKSVGFAPAIPQANASNPGFQRIIKDKLRSNF